MFYTFVLNSSNILLYCINLYILTLVLFAYYLALRSHAPGIGMNICIIGESF